MIRTHGYSGYAHGCRCDTCRAAKAAYVRVKRAAARANQGVKGQLEITHGYAGYQDACCRCYVCRWSRPQRLNGQQALALLGPGGQDMPSAETYCSGGEGDA